MRCTNRICRRVVTLLLAGCMVLSMTACSGRKFDMPYSNGADVSSFKVSPGGEEQFAESFASDICVVSADVLDEAIDMSAAGAGVLFDIDNNEVLYSVNAHERLHPASLTKVLTALVALKYGSHDQLRTASRVINIDESGAQLCGRKVGDTMTLNQALNILLVYSANDVAMMIAEGVGGTVEHFIELMNEEARALGATNSHFMNAHGLHHTDHYTTIYDIYLIFKEAVKHEAITQIIGLSSYSTTYKDKYGGNKNISVSTTNAYFKQLYVAPQNVTILVGKTGTTDEAGNCLGLYVKDTSGNPYIAVILHGNTRDDLYVQMKQLLEQVHR